MDTAAMVAGETAGAAAMAAMVATAAATGTTVSHEQAAWVVRIGLVWVYPAACSSQSTLLHTSVLAVKCAPQIWFGSTVQNYL